jgi:hypothetical protein
VEAPDEIADELYGAPFDEFIARRGAAVKELRKEKRREEADAVKALRKPALSAWTINQLARQARDDVDQLLAAGAALRQAKAGDTLRDATRDERGAVDRLVEQGTALLREAGHTVTDKTAGELRDTLHAAALDDEVRDLLDRGRLVEPRQAIGLGAFEGAGPLPSPKRQRQRQRQRARDEKPRKDEAAERRKRIQAAGKALSEAEAVLEERQAEVERAERQLARAREAAAQARADVDSHQAELDEASG